MLSPLLPASNGDSASQRQRGFTRCHFSLVLLTASALLLVGLFRCTMQQEKQELPNHGPLAAYAAANESGLLEIACARMPGIYVDNWQQTIMVHQRGCAVTFEYQGDTKSGQVGVRKLWVDGWAVGMISSSGAVTFGDNGYWHLSCMNMHGAFTDTKGRAVTVQQYGCKFTLVPDDILDSFVLRGYRSGEISGRRVIVNGWKVEGAVQMDGTVSFEGGYSWLRGWCEGHTGGTCLFFSCNAVRHATCESHAWCVCPPFHCSDSKGICHEQGASSLESVRFPEPAWFRKQVHLIWYAFLALLAFRVEIFLWSAVGFCLRDCCAHRDYAEDTPTSRASSSTIFTFHQDMPWRGWGLKTVASALCRLIFFHWMQPLVFALAIYAYYPLMGRWQLWATVLIGIRECLYFLSTVLGAIVAPHFLRFTLAPPNSVDMMLLYIACPQYFVAWTLRMQSRSLNTYAQLTILCSIIGDCCAILAMLIGFGGTGMGKLWPTLFWIYSITFLSVPSAAWVWANGTFDAAK